MTPYQRGAQIAQVDIARRLAEAIRHMLTPQPILRSGGRHVASGSTLTAHH